MVQRMKEWQGRLMEDNAEPVTTGRVSKHSPNADERGLKGMVRTHPSNSEPKFDDGIEFGTVSFVDYQSSLVRWQNETKLSLKNVLDPIGWYRRYQRKKRWFGYVKTLRVYATQNGVKK